VTRRHHVAISGGLDGGVQVRALNIAGYAVAMAAALTACAPPAEAGKARAAAACEDTAIASLGPRLEGVPDSGSGVIYANGKRQVSYEVVPQLQRSRPGDPVRLCLVERPRNCPPGDTRGSRYAATNLRTSEHWSLYDSQHRCGGA